MPHSTSSGTLLKDQQEQPLSCGNQGYFEPKSKLKTCLTSTSFCSSASSDSYQRFSPASFFLVLIPCGDILENSPFTTYLPAHPPMAQSLVTTARRAQFHCLSPMKVLIIRNFKITLSISLNQLNVIKYSLKTCTKICRKYIGLYLDMNHVVLGLPDLTR